MPVHPITVNRLSSLAITAACLVFLVAVVWSYPLGPGWLTACVLLYFAALWHWPSTWLIWMPALLPVLDLAPWTGRFFCDEFDCLLAATLACESMRTREPAEQISTGRISGLLLASITLTALISTALGLFPLTPIDVNSFNNYYSPFNALRVVKGLIWALLLLPIYKYELARNTALTHRRFATGMTVGVLLAASAVIWERAEFAGLFNFHSGYRVVGLFSSMHIGGAYIEAYFATALPFVAWWTLHVHSRPKRIIGALIFAMGIYALAVTYARGAYLALGIGMLVFVITLSMQRGHAPRFKYRQGGLALLALLALIALPVIFGPEMQRRYATSQHDMRARAAHWVDAIQMMDDTVAAKLFGMGLGTYPRLYYVNSAENVHSSLYKLAFEAGKPALFLSSGEPVYFEQFVDLDSQHKYSLTFTARNIFGQSELMFPICEKWMLYSVNCLSQSVSIRDIDLGWKNFTLTFDGAAFRPRTWYARRPVKFAIFNNSETSIAAISDVSLRDETGREYLKNGDFADGMDHWFFTSDNHLPWHLENLWVQIYFEQGAFGLLVFLLMIMIIMVKLIALNRLHHPFTPAMAASISAFLALSAFDSLFDFPRMSLLFYTMIFLVLSESISTRFIGVGKHKIESAHKSQPHKYGMDA